MFRAAASNPVPFVPAEANGRKDVLTLEGARPPAMTLWWLPAGDGGKGMSKTDYLPRMAAACATEIARLLTLGQSGAAAAVS